jgi:hypothetical protein
LKFLSIIDEFGVAEVLMCEKCYKRFLPKISQASEHGVGVVISDSKARGCFQCKLKKSGESYWKGPMLKIWRGHRKGKE